MIARVGTRVGTRGAAPGPPPPALVVGMHGSGTTILAELLDRFGLFLGVDSAHAENSFFRDEVAEAIALGDEGRWARLPLPSLEEVQGCVPAARALVEREWLARYRALGYDGAGPWGFKDPRSCLVLPLYLAIFPGARVLHIVRDPDDVAASLARTRKRGVGGRRDPPFWRDLAEAYVARVRWCAERHPNPYLEIGYEALCRDPAPVLRRVFDFVRIGWTPEAERFARRRLHARSVGRAGRAGSSRLATWLKARRNRRA
jgi:hypothetical protein